MVTTKTYRKAKSGPKALLEADFGMISKKEHNARRRAAREEELETQEIKKEIRKKKVKK